MFSRRVWAGALWIVVTCGAPGSALAAGPEALHRAELTRTVVNVDLMSTQLLDARPRQLREAPAETGTLLYGLIPRRVGREDFRDADHHVPFMVQYVLGSPAAAWCDVNMNGDLRDDPPVRLLSYEPLQGARAFLVDLKWTAATDAGDLPIDWTIRVVLEPGAAQQDDPPNYRVQSVHGMLGTITLEGKPHRTLLYDGNFNGVYRAEFQDGLFVDLNDDDHFDIDPMSPEFGGFSAPFQMGHRLYEVASLDASGTEVTLREEGVAEPVEQAAVGAAAPTFSFRDAAGRTIRLKDYRDRVVVVYFWSSRCGSCLYQAEPLKALYDRYRGAGLEILGISYDTDRDAMESFRHEHGQTWPTSFSGRMYWEDPVGKLFRADASGMFYLVDREGKLEGIYGDVAALDARLGRILSGSAPASR